MADGAGADPGAEEPELRHAGLDHDIAEVKRLLAFSRRPSVARHLALLVSELQQEKAKLSQALQKGLLGFPRASAVVGSPASAALLARTSSDSIHTSLHLGSACSPMEGISLPYPAIQGVAPLMGSLDRIVPGFMPAIIDERQCSGHSDHSDSATFLHVSGLPERPGLPGPLAPGMWPPALAPGGPAVPALPFAQLTTCSWEQNDTIVKVYVPLRGVQTDMLRPVFTPTSAEVRVTNLQGKNYVFTLAPTFYPIAEVGCTAAASKTRKNIIITLQKLHTFLPEHRQWRGLYGGRAGLPGLGPM